MGSGGEPATDSPAPVRLVSGEDGDRHNLPARLTSFVGREQEISEIGRLLGSTRLLSLVGSGGGGKTRLAIEYAAADVSEFAHGAWLVELAPITDGSLVVPAIADVFEIREQQGVPGEWELFAVSGSGA
jgi:hypothetical protein